MADWRVLLFIQRFVEMSFREYYFKWAIRLSFDLSTDKTNSDSIAIIVVKFDFAINLISINLLLAD